jgi:hypothetical protein
MPLSYLFQGWADHCQVNWRDYVISLEHHGSETSLWPSTDPNFAQRSAFDLQVQDQDTINFLLPEDMSPTAAQDPEYVSPAATDDGRAARRNTRSKTGTNIRKPDRYRPGTTTFEAGHHRQ